MFWLLIVLANIAFGLSVVASGRGLRGTAIANIVAGCLCFAAAFLPA